MRRSVFLSFILSFVMLASSLPAYASQSCIQGQVFDATLGKCIATSQAQNLSVATQDCKGNAECYRKIAEDELKKAESEEKVDEQIKDKSGLFNKALNASAIVVPLFIGIKMLIGSHATNPCSKVSMIAMLGASAALLAGTLFAGKGHKKRLKKIKTEWDAKKDQTNGQSEAFEMLAKGEDSLASAASQKATYYTIALAAFSASAVAAILEQVSPDGGLCYASIPQEKLPFVDYKVLKIAQANLLDANSLDQYFILKKEVESVSLKLSSPTLDEYEYLKNSIAITNTDPSLWPSIKDGLQKIKIGLHPMPEAIAQAEAGVLVEEIVVTGRRIPFYAKPLVRAAVSAVFAGWSGLMMNHAKKQARVSKRRAEFLRNMKATFKTPDGSVNVANGISNSKATDAASGSNNQSSDTSNSSSTESTCATSSGTLDESCSCRSNGSCGRTVIGKLNNQKLGFSGVGGPTTGLINQVSEGLSPAQEFMNGAGAAEVNQASAFGAAMRNLDTVKSLEKNLKPQLKSFLLSEKKSIEEDLLKAGAGLRLADGSSSSTPIGNLNQNSQSSGTEKRIDASDSNSISSIGSGNSEGNAIAITSGESSQQSENLKIAGDASEQVDMKTEFEYGAAEIETADRNLFEQISSRYKKVFRRKID